MKFYARRKVYSRNILKEKKVEKEKKVKEDSLTRLGLWKILGKNRGPFVKRKQFELKKKCLNGWKNVGKNKKENNEDEEVKEFLEKLKKVEKEKKGFENNKNNNRSNDKQRKENIKKPVLLLLLGALSDKITTCDKNKGLSLTQICRRGCMCILSPHTHMLLKYFLLWRRLTHMEQDQKTTYDLYLRSRVKSIFVAWKMDVIYEKIIGVVKTARDLALKEFCFREMWLHKNQQKGYLMEEEGEKGKKVEEEGKKGVKVDKNHQKGYLMGDDDMRKKMEGEGEKGVKVEGEGEKGKKVEGEGEKGVKVEGEGEKGKKVEGEGEKGKKVEGEGEKGVKVEGEGEKVV
jgi:hypothetical protein